MHIMRLLNFSRYTKIKLLIFCVVALALFLIYLTVILPKQLRKRKAEKEARRRQAEKEHKEQQRLAAENELYNRLKSNDVIQDILKRIFQEGIPETISIRNDNIKFAHAPSRYQYINFRDYGYNDLPQNGNLILSRIVNARANNIYSTRRDYHPDCVYMWIKREAPKRKDW